MRSTVSQAIAICAALTLLWVEVGAVFFLREELITGQTYSPTVVFGDGRRIYRITSPNAYWMDIGLYILCFVVGIIPLILGPREVIIEQKRKNSATAGKSLRNNVSLIVCALVYLGLLLAISLLIQQSNPTF
jgi:hypothetical protein